jgi:ketosteroid isomerase-like protein
MSANTDLALEVIRHFNTLDADGLTNLVTDNIKHTATGTLYNTDLEGREEYLAYIRNLLSKFNKCDFHPYNVFDVAEANVVVVEWTADFTTDTDIEWKSRGVLIFDIVDGKIDWVRDYFDTEKTKSIYST